MFYVVDQFVCPLYSRKDENSTNDRAVKKE